MGGGGGGGAAAHLTGAGSESGRPPRQAAGTAPTAGGQVVVRDERGVLSVMHCLPEELIRDPGFQQTFRAESAALAALGEPRLAEPLSYIMDAGGRIVAIVRRYFPGVPLFELLSRARNGRGLDAQAAATVASDVLVALDALHRRGVAHRRLDAGQVVVGRGGECVLVGAGLAVRPEGGDLGSAMAFDLSAVLELFALCVTAGRAPVRDVAAAAQHSAGKLHGVAQDIYTALNEARHAPVDRWEQGTVAAEMLAALEEAAHSFGAGWRERGHERLAVCARTLRRPRAARADRQTRESRRRPTALITRSALIRGGAQDASGTARAARAAAAGTAATIATAAMRSGGIPREARGVLPKGGGKRAARRGGFAGGRLRVLAVLVPLAVLLFAIALIGGMFSGSARKTPPPPPSLPVETGAQAPVNSAIASVAADAPATAGPSSSPTRTTAQVAVASPTPVTAVTSLSISSLTFTAAQSSTATVVVNVRASGTATVNVAVTISENGPYGPNSRTDHFTFSGQHQYSLSDNFRAMPCSWGNMRQVAASVSVSSTVPSTNAAPAVASGNLYSTPCGR